MFLLDGGLLLGAYFCVRLIEKYHKKTRKNKKSFKNQSVSVKPSQPMVLNERNMLSPSEKQFDHYLKLSTVSVGVAAARQFFFPSISLFNAALYAYIAFPALREAEKSLVQNRKINGYVLDAMLITLALSQC